MKKVKIYQSELDLNQNVPVGTIITIELEGVTIAISHTKNGYYAFNNQCPHNKASLSDGMCNIYDEIVCPWHNYRYDLKSGNETSGHGLYLKTYHLDISDEGVYLTL